MAYIPYHDALSGAADNAESAEFQIDGGEFLVVVVAGSVDVVDTTFDSAEVVIETLVGTPTAAKRYDWAAGARITLRAASGGTTVRIAEMNSTTTDLRYGIGKADADV